MFYNKPFCLKVIAWASVGSICVFGTLRLTGLIRVHESVEDAGLDQSEHGAPKTKKNEAQFDTSVEEKE